ncbi:hypothetical protein [Brachybacterium sp. Z12]|uniref:hypothetical protein n=1 Tax=Brachybacterium sp. Z12 TaxID=2759167 RepID=UPI00223BB1E0|nr:hypothetical protein [Brachybacterium sp. Z12]
MPAWAELGAELGAADDGADRLTRNPYSEWYANTIRIEGSAAAEHHRAVHGGAPTTTSWTSGGPRPSTPAPGRTCSAGQAPTTSC